MTWVRAQSERASYALGLPINGAVISVPVEGVILTDDNQQADGSYTAGIDYSVTLTLQSPCPEPSRLGLSFSLFDIAAEDTLYIYDGASMDAPLLAKANNVFHPLSGNASMLYVSPSNNSYSLTIRFVTRRGSSGHQGFSCEAFCSKPCERVVPSINSRFYRLRNGEIYDSVNVRKEPTSNGSFTFDCVNLCMGDGLLLKAHGTYESRHGYYTGSDATSSFLWDMGADRDGVVGSDTLLLTGTTELKTDYYSDTSGCFELFLTIIDDYGCRSSDIATVRVRVTTNPIKTIASQLPVFCSNDSVQLRVSSNMNDAAQIVVDTLLSSEVVSKVNNVKTFIPDGPSCNYCYRAPVTFTEFPDGRSVTSKDDICSICINFEHSYMGDYNLSVVCPTGQKATLKYKEDPGDMPYGAYGGNSLMTGYPYGGDDDDDWDSDNSRRVCDSSYNMYGIGLDYCFSRNGDYTLVDGWPADTDAIGNHFLADLDFVDDVVVDFPARPSYMRSGDEDAGTREFSTKHPSDHANKSDYYRPADDFSSLIGCPLNGEWSILICDSVAYDNGWIFNWSMDICQLMDEMDCTFDVHVDSVRWAFEPDAGRTVNGRYVGPYIQRKNDSVSFVKLSDTAGSFPLWAYVYDDFGCRWDAQTLVRSIRVPQPQLGDTRYLCTDVPAELTAEDPHAQDSYSYLWLPTGETTSSIVTETGLPAGSRTTYVVSVTNDEDASVSNCVGKDSVVVEILPQPLPNFDVDVYPMEGCEPLEEHFTNHSRFADTYLWSFSDGFTSTEFEPSHSFVAGTYDIRLYAFNSYGCKDSVVFPAIVSVSPRPVARFSWSPAFPPVRDPKITMENLSEADSDRVQYTWRFQTDRDNPASLQPVEEEAPVFTWSLGDNQDAASFLVRLTASIETVGPSGQVFECADSTENQIYVLNDYLQFPTLVTPNGDGVNDKFIIKNLVNGWAYPNNVLVVYTRMGKRIFYAENIDDEADFWDPAKTHSPTGTYFWHFTARGPVGMIERSGAVEVIK